MHAEKRSDLCRNRLVMLPCEAWCEAFHHMLRRNSSGSRSFQARLISRLACRSASQQHSLVTHRLRWSTSQPKALEMVLHAGAPPRSAYACYAHLQRAHNNSFGPLRQLGGQLPQHRCGGVHRRSRQLQRQEVNHCLSLLPGLVLGVVFGSSGVAGLINGCPPGTLMTSHICSLLVQCCLTTLKTAVVCRPHAQTVSAPGRMALAQAAMAPASAGKQH